MINNDSNLERMFVSVAINPCGFIENLLYKNNILKTEDKEIVDYQGKFYKLESIEEKNTENTNYRQEVINKVKEGISNGELNAPRVYVESKFNRELTENEISEMATNYSYI